MAFQNVGLRVTILGVSAFRRSIGDVERATSSLNRSLGASSGPLRSISTGLDNLGTTFMNVGRMMTMYVTVPLAALSVGLVAAGISFEDAFSGVSKTVEGVADDFGTLTDFGLQFRKQLVDLSLELPISANELARVAQAAGQVGVSKENLLEFTKIAAKMGIATNIASEDAAISLARLANILGITQKDFVGWATNASSAVVRLGNNVAATESEIMNMALRIAPVGGVVGLTTAEILGLSAALAEVGVRSERGGTAVSRVFLEMAEAAGQSSFANEELNASLEGMQPALNQLRSLLNSGVTNFNDLQFALRDTGLDLSGLSGLLDDLGGDDGRFADLNDQIKRNDISLGKFTRKVSALEMELAQANAEFESGNITYEEHAKIVERIVPQLDNLNGSIEQNRITAGGYTRSLQELNAEMVSVDDIIKHVSQNTIMEFEGAMASSSSKVATFARIMGVSEQEFSAAFGAKPLETFQRFLVEVAKLQDEGKITAEVLTEIGLGGVRVREILNILGPNINLVTDNVAMANDEWIKHTALQVEVQKKFATTKAQLQLLKNAVVALGIELFFKLKPSIDGVIKSLLNFITELKGLLFGPIDLLPKKIDGVTTSVWDFGGAIALVERRRYVTNFRKNFKRLFLVALALGPVLTGVGIALKLLALPFAGLSKILTRIVPLAKLLFTALIGIFTSPALLIGIGAITAVVGGLYLVFKTNFLGITDLVKDLWASFNQFTNTGVNLKNAFKDLLSGDIDGAVKNLHLAWGSFVFWFENYAIPLISEWADKAWPELKRLAGVFVDWVIDVIPDVLEAIGKLLGKIGDWIIFTGIPTLWDKLADWTEAFVSWVIDIWPELILSLGGLLLTIGQWVIDVTPGIIEKLLEWMWAFVLWADKIWPRLLSTVANFLTYFIGWMIGAAAKLLYTIITEWLPAFVNWVLDDMWPDLKIELDEFKDKFVEWIKTDAKTDISAAFAEIGLKIAEIGLEAGKLFIIGLAEGAGIPVGTLQKYLDEVTGTIEGWGDDVSGVIADTANEIKDATAGGGGNNLFDIFSDKFDEIVFGKSSPQNSNQATIDSLKGFFGNSMNLGGVLGETVPSTSSSSTTNSSVFAPTISGVPMTSEESMTQEIIRAWRMAQGIGNG